MQSSKRRKKHLKENIAANSARARISRPSRSIVGADDVDEENTAVDSTYATWAATCPDVRCAPETLNSKQKVYSISRGGKRRDLRSAPRGHVARSFGLTTLTSALARRSSCVVNCFSSGSCYSTTTAGETRDTVLF